MSAAVVPGSYDPVHNGHVDVIERVARHFETVIAAVVHNPNKTTSAFTLEERQDMLREVLGHLGNVEVDAYSGLTVDFARSRGAKVITKGLRAVSDFDSELQQAAMNHKLTGVDTLFVAASPSNFFLSSSLIKEVAKLGGDISGLVPPVVEQRLKERFS